MQALESATQLAPKDLGLLAERAYAELRAGALEAAEAHNNELLSQELENDLAAQVYYNQAQVAMQLGRLVEARLLFEESLSLRPHPSVETALRRIPETDVLCADGVSLEQRCRCERAELDPGIEHKLSLSLLLDASYLSCRPVPVDSATALGSPAQGHGAGGRLSVVLAGNSFTTVGLLLDLKHGTRVVKRLANLNNPGAMGISSGLEISALTERSLGGKTVWALDWLRWDTDHDGAGAHGVSGTTQSTTFCLLTGDDIDCPRTIVTRASSAKWGVYAAGAATGPDGSRVTVNEQATVALKADGTITIRRTLPTRETETTELW